MFWGIYQIVWFMNRLGEEVRVQLWAGVFGAIPAAVLSSVAAAWVAMKVLEQSNLDQTRLARDAVQVQRGLAAMQLNEQRVEAARVREQSVSAEVVVATEEFLAAAHESPAAVRNQLSVLRRAVASWRVELGPGPMQKELLEWPGLLLNAGTLFAHAEGLGSTGSGGKAFVALKEAISVFSAVALHWPTADRDARNLLRSLLEEKRPVIDEMIKEMLAGSLAPRA